MSIKKRIAIILSFLLVLLSVCSLSEDSSVLSAVAGETVEVEFTVLEDTGAVFAATVELQYDRKALELVPNRIFDEDIKMYMYGLSLRASFRIRENAAPGDYPVTLKIIGASGPMGEAILSPETALVFSEEHIKVERPPVEVPVYYYDAATGVLLRTETKKLPAGWSGMVTGNAPEGYVITGGQSMQVTVSEDGQAMPPVVTFWLTMPTPVPTATPSPTPLPGISLNIVRKVGSNRLSWDPVPGAERYRVYRGTSGNGNYGILAAVDGNTYTDSEVRGGTAYYYMVEAVFPNGQTVTAQKSAVAATATPSPTPKPTPIPLPVNVGGYITFGHYEQDNNTGNGKEPIEWLVLEVRGDQALVISRYGLDVRPYNRNYDKVTWETCSLRKWLNGEFLNDAFNPGEQKAIIMTTVDNSNSQGYSGWNTRGGKNTEDRIFLLSYAEAWRYFSNDRAGQCLPTRYAAGRSAHTSGSNCEWWLRSPGYFQNNAAGVCTDSSLFTYRVNNNYTCVRPALWINLDSGYSDP